MSAEKPQPLAVAFRPSSRKFSANVRDTILIICGIFSAVIGLKGFLIPNHFIDGGVTGISMLLAKISGLPLQIFIILLNAPFLIAAYKQVSVVFALRSLAAVLGLSIVLFFLDFPIVTDDKLLTAVFGGFFLGAGIGLSIRGGSVLDGTEIFALLVSKRTSLTIGDVILVVNIIIFIAAAFVLGVEPALYSVVTYLAASRTIDFIIHGIEEYTGVTIISTKNAHIREAILTLLGRAVTVYKGKRGFTDDEIEILYCVITRLEIQRLKKVVGDIDPNAFMFMNSINETTGGMIKKRPFHS